jgi:hypothetical protein
MNLCVHFHNLQIQFKITPRERLGKKKKSPLFIQVVCFTKIQKFSHIQLTNFTSQYTKHNGKCSIGKLLIVIST